MAAGTSESASGLAAGASASGAIVHGFPPLKVCYVIPMYNEAYCELSGTLRSIAENIEVWRRSTMGRSREIEVTLVIVQDGWSNCEATSRRYFHMDLGCPLADDIDRIMKNERLRVGQEQGIPGGVDGVAIIIPEAVRAGAVAHHTFTSQRSTAFCVKPNLNSALRHLTSCPRLRVLPWVGP